MIQPNPDHSTIVADSLTGARELDDQTFASLNVLAARLERVRALGGDFAQIGFSPDAEQFRQQKLAAV
jgi:hypothetical protein